MILFIGSKMYFEHSDQRASSQQLRFESSNPIFFEFYFNLQVNSVQRAYCCE